ncbi:GTP-binding protein [Actinomadura rubrisoli]|uniref:ATP/GTP-binding protein n=1 Tax=Actinomadura rubrisoli TaxID=2530368 RepID=A0A4R5BX29_9ACTN|nr:ATP/GTP-binding protein [Actinomadura rubrisoli]TDD90795.1 ATP/GTP-binding protein [Actinomadura rubrisoli]
MNSVRSDPPPDGRPADDEAGDRYDGPRVALKILVAGGFGVGKTTMVGAVSEIRPLRTEEALTDASVGVDDLDGVAAKSTTTVAMDFGRITLRDGVAIYLFGTPGQERFWFMWNELSRGALGAVVLADTRRLTSSFASIDYFEERGTPFVVAVNCFDGADRYDPPEVRTALDIDPHVPVLLCDARQTGSAKEILVALVEHALRLAGGQATNGRGESPRAWQSVSSAEE